MIGEVGEAIEDIDQTGRVFVHGEYWLAHSDRPIKAGSTVKVVKLLDGLKLEVVEESVSTNDRGIKVNQNSRLSSLRCLNPKFCHTKGSTSCSDWVLIFSG